MPNWCNNSISVSHPDKEMMQKFRDGVRAGNLFDTFIPMPVELRETTSPSETNEVLVEKYGHSDWYSWSIDNWGTKWDVCEGEFNLDENELSGDGWFDTAWGPPITAYQKLKELGFVIEAFYSEPGMGFCGVWENGEEDYIDGYYELFEEGKFPDNTEGLHTEIRYFLEAEYESWKDEQEWLEEQVKGAGDE